MQNPYTLLNRSFEVGLAEVLDLVADDLRRFLEGLIDRFAVEVVPDDGAPPTLVGTSSLGDARPAQGPGEARQAGQRQQRGEDGQRAQRAGDGGRRSVGEQAAPADLDKGTELVCLAEPVGASELLDVAEAVRRRLVVMGDPQLERELGEAFDCLGRDP